MSILQLTIRQRLPLYISVTAIVILLLQGIFIYLFSVRFCEQEFRSRIQERLYEADSLISKDRQHPFTAINTLPAGNLPEEKIFYLSDLSQFDAKIDENFFPILSDTLQFDHFNYYFKHIGQREYGIHHDSLTHHTLVVSAVDRYGNSKINNLKYGIFIGIMFGVLLLTFASWFWVKTMLQPISEKIKKARDIGANSLNLRLNISNSHDELGQLALTFNEMLERIEQSFRNHQQFIRNASHEIRTPLTAITTETELALQTDRSPEYHREALQNIRLHAENLGDLVAQLLLMAKIDVPGSFNDGPCASDEVLMKSILAVQIKYSLTQQAIQLQIDAPDANLFLVRCDATILQAAFTNLLDNAIKYGSNKPILVRLYTDQQLVCLEVKDQGLGIAPEDLDQIFNPFYRSNQHLHLPGSGIGLSLVKNIAEKYGGSAHVQSKPGQGTLVRFDLPRWIA